MKHTLLSAFGELVADDWARPWVQPTRITGAHLPKMRHTCGATSADVHCIKYMYTNVAALSSMTVCRAPGSASPAEQQTLRRLCEGLGAVDIVAFPCHASLQLLVLAHRVVEGRLADLSPAGLSRALVADPRLLPVFEAAMGAEPARGWAELHRSAFPPPVDRRASPAPQPTRSVARQGAAARARVQEVGDTVRVTDASGFAHVFKAMPARLAQPNDPSGAVVYWDPKDRPYATGLVRKWHIEGALALHPGAFELGPSPSYAALNDEWFTLRFFPAAAFTTPITKHTLLSAAGQLVADDWARPRVQPTTWTGTQVLKMRHTCGATSADVHCIKYMYTNVAALSSMTVCGAPGSASPAEQQTLWRLCKGLGAVGIVAFPCHAGLQLVVLAHRVVEGRLTDLSPAGLSRALVADPRLLPVFEAAMGAMPARGWAELHRLAFPPPVDRRASPAPQPTRSVARQGAAARA